MSGPFQPLVRNGQRLLISMANRLYRNYLTEMIAKRIMQTPELAAAPFSRLIHTAWPGRGRKYFTTAANPAIPAMTAATGPPTATRPTICAKLRMTVTVTLFEKVCSCATLYIFPTKGPFSNRASNIIRTINRFAVILQETPTVVQI